jgi:hypothetical protein
MVALWSVAVMVCTLFACWLVAGLNPALASAELSWQSPAFVEDPSSDDADEPKDSWVAGGQESGAWASVLVQNKRPYPVTVSPGLIHNTVEVRVAAYDPDAQVVDISPDGVTAVPYLQVPSGGFVVVSMRPNYRCFQLMAGSSVGNDVVPVNVMTFGLTHSLDVPFPAIYMAGPYTDYVPDALCTER